MQLQASSILQRRNLITIIISDFLYLTYNDNYLLMKMDKSAEAASSLKMHQMYKKRTEIKIQSYCTV